MSKGSVKAHIDIVPKLGHDTLISTDIASAKDTIATKTLAKLKAIPSVKDGTTLEAGKSLGDLTAKTAAPIQVDITITATTTKAPTTTTTTTTEEEFLGWGEGQANHARVSTNVCWAMGLVACLLHELLIMLQ